MKKIILLLLLCLSSHAQQSTFQLLKVGDSSPIDSSAIVEAKSTTKGLLVPRMTTTQKNAISSPATGLMVYDTVLGRFSAWNGSSWASIGSGGGVGSVTLVGLTAPSFLTVNNQPITTSGTIALSYSGTPLPTTNGGTNNSNSILNTNRVIVSTSTSLAESSTTSTQLSFLDATSSIQTQLNGKQSTLSLPLSISNGGTNTSNPLFNNRLVVSSGGTIGETASIAPAFALSSNALGIPIANTTTSTELGFVSGVTSSIQTQLNSKTTLSLPVSITNGGTSTSNPVFNNRIIVSSGGTIGEAGAITTGRALASNALGIPIASTTTNTELGFVSGVTSSIQTQLNGKQSTLTLPLSVVNGGTNTSNPLFNNRLIVSSGGTIGETAGITSGRALASNALGIPIASTTTNTELGFVSGVTSSIQTQINGKQAALTLPLSIANGGTNTSNPLFNNRIAISSGGTIGEAGSIAPAFALSSNALGIPIANTTTSTELGYLSGVTSSVQTQINSKTTLSLPVSVTNGGTNTSNPLFNNRVIVSSGGTIGEFGAGTLGYLLTSGGSSGPAAWASLPTILSNAFVSSQVTTLSSANTSASFATFSNSPAFSVTPTTSGNYKVYSYVPTFVDTTSTKGVLRVINTSGGATLLNESQGAIDNGGALIITTNAIQSTYTLTAGVTYVFDLQGKVLAGAGGIYLDGSDAPFYMWAEPQLATPGSNVSSVALAAPAFMSVTGSPITTSGTLTLSLSGTALPVTSGGTNTSNPLFNNRVIISSGGTIGESGVSSTTLAFLDVNSSVQKALNGYSAHAHGSTSTVGNGVALIAFSTTDWDTANAYNSSTGVYTVPVAGKYHVSGSVDMTATTAVAGQNYQLKIVQNNVPTALSTHFVVNAVDKQSNIFINDDVNCNAGDSIAIVGTNNNTGPSILNTTPVQNWFSIFKFGN